MEIIANAVQTVQSNQSVYFTDSVTCGNAAIVHRDDSSIVTLRGIANQCRARFMVTFSANIAVATGGTLGPISLAIALDGEAIPSTTMIVTPAAIGDYFNVSSAIFIDVPRGCCSQISVKNITATTAVDVQNANLIIERVA